MILDIYIIYRFKFFFKKPQKNTNFMLPKMNNYHNNGSGRDTFISFNSGGNNVKQIISKSTIQGELKITLIHHLERTRIYVKIQNKYRKKIIFSKANTLYQKNNMTEIIHYYKNRNLYY